MQNTRSTNFELLRVVAILLIIAHHFAIYSILDSGLYERMDLSCKLFSCILSPGGEVGVALFFMISGFFLSGSTKERPLKNIIMQVFFYSYLTLFIFVAFRFLGIYSFATIPSDTLMRDILKMLLIPSNSGVWWYVTAYCMLIILVPVINKNLRWGGVFILLYFIGKFDTPFYYIFKAVFFYYLGYVASSHKLSHFFCGKTNLLLFVISWLLYAGTIFLNYSYYDIYTSSSFVNRIINEGLEWVRVCFLVPLSAFSLFCCFKSLTFNVGWINKLSTHVFGVYLFHGSTMITPLLFTFFINPPYNNFWAFSAYAIISVFAIFIIGTLVDSVRVRFFQPYYTLIYDKIIQILKFDV